MFRDKHIILVSTRKRNGAKNSKRIVGVRVFPGRETFEVCEPVKSNMLYQKHRGFIRLKNKASGIANSGGKRMENEDM